MPDPLERLRYLRSLAANVVLNSRREASPWLPETAAAVVAVTVAVVAVILLVWRGV